MSVLHGVRVLELASEIAGPYCGKLLADAGADVVKVERAGGDPLRSSGSGALFAFLNTSKRSVLVEDTDMDALVASVDVVVDDGTVTTVDPPDGPVVVAISPFGRTGPWASRPATEFTLQAWCGSTGSRGVPEDPPLAAGGRLGEWIGGSYAAALALASLRGAPGARVDLSLLECMAITMNTYNSVFAEFLGWPEMPPAPRNVEIPSIEPTADGYVGVCTITAQQFADFLVLIGRPDLMEDRDLATAVGRFARRTEMEEATRKWTAERTTAEIIEEASLLRIPVAPVHDGATVTSFPHFVERGVFVEHPDGFIQPRVPYRISDPGPPSVLTEPRGTSISQHTLPLGGLRVVDFTAFWAGPAATNLLAVLGADVIKIESTARPDGMRFTTTRPPSVDQWWEWGPLFHGVNGNKRSVTLDLATDEGRALCLRLIGTADAVVENFTPRVLEQFGLGWDAVSTANPSVVMVRMPAFGLDGPWRDRTGFAQTMEQVSGLASMTGWRDGPPLIPRGACDPLAGLHAVAALLLALAQRDRDGQGRLVEVTLVEAALNAAAEAIVEASVTGTPLTRDGNRSRNASPQGVYECAKAETWIALSVVSDEQWKACANVAGVDAALDRWLEKDALDEALSAWAATGSVEDAVNTMLEAGVPAAIVVAPRDIHTNPHLRSRGFFERIDHPVTGPFDLPSAPFALTGRERGWVRHPAPTLGQHNDEILGAELGLPADELARLRESGIIGDRPRGA